MSLSDLSFLYVIIGGVLKIVFSGCRFWIISICFLSFLPLDDMSPVTKGISLPFSCLVCFLSVDCRPSKETSDVVFFVCLRVSHVVAGANERRLYSQAIINRALNLWSGHEKDREYRIFRS